MNADYQRGKLAALRVKRYHVLRIHDENVDAKKVSREIIEISRRVDCLSAFLPVVSCKRRQYEATRRDARGSIVELRSKLKPQRQSRPASSSRLFPPDSSNFPASSFFFSTVPRATEAKLNYRSIFSEFFIRALIIGPIYSTLSFRVTSLDYVPFEQFSLYFRNSRLWKHYRFSFQHCTSPLNFTVLPNISENSSNVR